MDERYAARYRELHEHHWWWRARERFILGALRRHAPAGGWGHILDVGCGDGLFFDRLAEFGEVEGIDPNASTSQRDGRCIFVAPFDAAFDPGRRYSLILFLDVLEHLDDPESSLRRASELLERDGSILITVPAFPALWTQHDVLNRHRTRYTRRTLTELLGAAGFDVVDSRYLFYWLAAAKLLLRGVEHVFGQKPAPPLLPPSSINRGLELACAWEERFLGPFRPPFGSSLMAFARRKNPGRRRTLPGEGP